jgi:hypothetical protein
MAKTNALIPVRYRDEKSGIRLTSYADFAAYDDAGGRRTLRAIRFGGYPEQTEALSAAIYGGRYPDAWRLVYEWRTSIGTGVSPKRGVDNLRS